MPLSIQVVWGGRWSNGQRLTPENINRIFELATFTLQGTLDAATIPPGGITSSWIGPTFVSGLTPATPEGPDWLMGHDTSANLPRKFLVSDVLALGLGAAASITTMAEGDEFVVLQSGVSKRIALPLIRKELVDTPNQLVWGSLDYFTDRVLIFDQSGNEAKSTTSAHLVRSVTDRVVTTGGTSTAYTLTSGLSLSSLATGIRLITKFHAAAGLAPTLNVDSRGAKALLTSDGGVIAAGRIGVGQIIEVVYDAAAASGAGAWLALGINASSGRTSVVFNGSIGVAWIGLSGDVDAVNDWVTVTSHGLVTGEVVWYKTSTGIPAVLTPYYVIATDVNHYRLASTKANALAGTYLQLTAQTDLEAYHWVTDPILKAENVDGVIAMEPGRYYIDFTTGLSNTNYGVAMAVEMADAGGPGNYASNITVDAQFKARSTDGFAVRTFVNTADDIAARWVSVTVFP